MVHRRFRRARRHRVGRGIALEDPRDILDLTKLPDRLRHRLRPLLGESSVLLDLRGRAPSAGRPSRLARGPLCGTHSGGRFVEPGRGLDCVLWPGAYDPPQQSRQGRVLFRLAGPQRLFRAGKDLDEASAPAPSSSQRRCMISGSSVDAVAPISSPCCWLSLPGPAVRSGASSYSPPTTGCNQ